MPLADTITPKIVLRKGETARKQCEEAENKLLGSALLAEERVPFPGDDADFQLHWLGDAPFMQVQVSSGVCQRYTDRNVPTAASPHFCGDVQDPLALTLHVKMLDKTFVSGLDKANKVHLKIEVFFNGQLSSCLFVPHYEIRSGAKSLHQVFAGCRVDYLSERPWTIIPPSKNADGSPRKSKASQSAHQRWTEISSALAEEAEQRGTDTEGNIPPTAQFLKALSSMQMPDQVQSMQSSRGTSFGTIDVVITAGEGRKITAGATYLRNPQRFTDENYALGQSCMPTLEGKSGSEHDKSKPSGGHKVNVIIDDDTGSDSGSDYEHQPKRRTLAPPVLSMKPSLHGSLTPVSYQKAGSEKVAPARGAGQARGEASVSIPERASGFQEYADHAQRTMFDSTPSSIPQNFDLFPSSGLGLVHTPQIQLTPYSVSRIDPTLGLDSPSNFEHLGSIEGSDFFSSPLHSFPRSAHMFALSSLGSQHTATVETAHACSGAGPESVEQMLLPRRASVGLGYATPLQSSGGSFGYVSSLVPISTTPDHHSPAVSNDLPHHGFTDRRSSMPLPPTGLFSVPTKPKPSLSPTKRSRVKNIEKGLNLLVKRLTIVGKNGSAVVDHRWANPRSIAIQPSNVICDVLGSSTDRLPARSSQADLTKTSNIQVPSHNPILTGPSLGSRRLHHTTKEGADTAGVGKDCTKKQDSARIQEDARVARSTKAVSGGVDQSIKAQRRTPSNSNILGVQGPKATTFWLEDPEEVLREAARLRRSRSPHKLKNTSNLQHTETSGVASTLKRPVIESSSPLSSLATTPDPDAANPTPPGSNVVAPGITQVDGPSDRMIMPTSPTKFASSPAKLANTADAQVFTQTPLLFTSSPACNSKKRKSQGRYLPKLPRDPDRLKTTSNPPLNEDCVIAFAESEDKDSDHGVLRQVKGERQGFFAEDYVVLATRFFVPGN